MIPIARSRANIQHGDKIRRLLLPLLVAQGQIAFTLTAFSRAASKAGLCLDYHCSMCRKQFGHYWASTAVARAGWPKPRCQTFLTRDIIVTSRRAVCIVPRGSALAARCSR